jgi:hypothetical protein
VDTSECDTELEVEGLPVPVPDSDAEYESTDDPVYNDDSLDDILEV